MSSQASSDRANLLQARARYQEVCRQSPSNFQAWWNLGRINLQLGHPQNALPAFDRALALKPTHLEVMIGKILACLGLNRLEEALSVVERAREIAPRNSDLRLHRAHILTLQGRNEEALAAYEQILALRDLSRQKRLFALAAKTGILTQLGRYEAALDTVDQGLAIGPNAPTFLLNRSTVLIRLRRYEEALAALEKLGAFQGLDFGGLSNKAQALAALRRFDESEEVLGELRARYPKPLWEREFYLPGRHIPEDSIAMGYTPWRLYLNGLIEELSECDWHNYEVVLAELGKLEDELRQQGSVPRVIEPFQLLSLPGSPDLRLAVAKARAEHIARSMEPLRDKLDFRHPSRKPGERLRIGYVSADIRDHPTAHLMRKLFQVHDRSRFEIFGYSLLPGDDSVYWRDISSACEHFAVLAGISNAEAARRIARDGIHILVDLHGYSRYARPEIFALRPAPVQVSYLAYPGTLGAGYIPYILADQVVLPEAHLPYYTEQPVYLPDCYQVNDDTQPVAETGITRAAQGLPEEAFVYCCFNASHKIEPETFSAWMRILKQVPDSVLWLLGQNPRTVANLRRAALDQGVNPERLVFASRLPKPEHLERHRLADVFLDTFVYNAHTTASDALWAGLPVLTLCGEAFPARVGASLLSAIGLPDLITYTIEEYEELAVSLAKDRQRLVELSTRLRANRLIRPLFDTERFARHLEQAFERMWAKREAGDVPSPVYVQPPEDIKFDQS